MADKKTPPADATQDALFREVDEDLREEQLAQLWKQWGHWIIGAATALVLVVAGYKGWQAWDLKTRSESGEAFAAAMDLVRGDKQEEAGRALAALVDGGGGYGLLARFQEASLLASKGDRAGAAAALRSISDDGGVEQTYRDLALLMSVLHEVDGGDPAVLRQRLEPLATDSSPWRHTARELTAVLAHRAGDSAKAFELFSALAEDAATPDGIRRRAQEMKTALEGRG